MPTLATLLARGYLPKELPSPFASGEFEQAVSTAIALPSSMVATKPKWTSSCTHVLGRPGAVPRHLSIPNPSAFYRLANEIASSWTTISQAVSSSAFSLTTPIDDPTGNRALVPAWSFERTTQRAELRAAFPYMLSTDIAQFYPSIYTHCLAWALHTKAVAKGKMRSRLLLGNRLDQAVQVGQDGHTSGIPIGPDTSLVLAELVLADCDKSLTGKVKGFRYFDDYELYFGSYAEAEQALVSLRESLRQYNLSLNSARTKVMCLPQPLQEEWITQLRRTELRHRFREERADLTVLFDDAFRLATRFNDANVVSYALGLLETRISSREPLVAPMNWPYLQRLVLQCIHAQTGTIQKAAGIISWANQNGLAVDRPLLSASLNRFILRAATLGHANEAAWGVWTAVTLRARIESDVAKRVAEMDDDVVALVALDARARRNFGKAVDVSRWQSWLNADQLDGQHWLVAYEAMVQGWLAPLHGEDHIAGHDLFGFLRSNGVHFYDRAATLGRKPRRAPPKFGWRAVHGY